MLKQPRTKSQTHVFMLLQWGKYGMSFDNINSSFAGYGRQGPQRPNAFASPSPAFGRSGPGSKPDAFMDNGIPFARAASESFTKEGTQTVVANTVHAMAAEGLNRFIPNGSR